MANTVMSESRQFLLRMIEEQAESASPERARALEDLSSKVEELPPFWVDVLRPGMLRQPAVVELLDAYGVGAADPEQVVQALGNALPDPRAYVYGRTPWGSTFRTSLPTGGLRGFLNLLDWLSDLLSAGVKWLRFRTARWWQERLRS